MATFVVCFQKEDRRQQKGIQQLHPKPAGVIRDKIIQAAFEVNKTSAKAGHHFLTSQFKEDGD